MNFYKHHLGDYDGATAHLSWDEDMAYTRLMRAYYRREQPIADADRYRLIRATSKAQRAAVDHVLGEFFTKDGDLWRNKRCDEEIAAYQAQAKTNKRIATNRQRTENEPSTKGSPVTSAERAPNQNQIPEPLTKNQEPGVLMKNSAQSISPTRAEEFARALCAKGVQVHPLNPLLAEWMGAGITLDQLLAAVATARARKPEPDPIPAAYLDRIIGDIGKPSGLNGKTKPWYLTASGIEAKGATHGLTPGADWQEFRWLVYEREGITGEMVTKAEGEYR